jgi:hypothetical protein
MKNKLSISLGMIVILVIGLFWFSNNKEQSKPVSSSQTVDSDNPAVKKIVPKENDVQQAETNTKVKPPATNQAALPATSHASLVEAMRAAIEAKNVQFDFYGKIIDQESNVLAGANLDIWARHWDPDSTAPIHITRKTDEYGCFDIHGITGDGFDIRSIGKEGYEIEPYAQRGFGAVGGSAENPVIFKMWSTNIHERLITGGKSFQIVPDGRPYFINLTDDTISESGEGELKVWIQYTNQVVRGQLYGWSCGVDVVNGGLLEEENQNSSMYVAPTDGYAPAFHLEQQIKGGQRGSIGDKRFYFMLRNGQEYGRMQIDLIAPFNLSTGIPAVIRLSYTLNPSGSRILR